MRQRLTAHRNNPVCAGCHRITDPIGLALEDFDAAGVSRSEENGAPIDASGDFSGKPFKNVVELSAILRDEPGSRVLRDRPRVLVRRGACAAR